MEVEWFLSDGEHIEGPGTFDELMQVLREQPDPLKFKVWRNGFENWKPVADVREFAEFRFNVNSPPPLSPDIPALSSTNVESTKNVVKGSPWAPWIALGVAAVIWGYFGFPSPITLANWFSAKSECVKFAQENKEKLFPSESGDIKAVGQWLKKGSIVVELGLFKDYDQNSYLPRLCVRNSDSIEIVSILESSAWR